MVKRSKLEQHTDDNLEYERRIRAPKLSTELEEKLSDLVEGLKIDPHALEEEWVQQSDLFYETSDQVTELIALRDAAKKNLADVEARVDGGLRRSHRERESKITEPEIKAQIRSHIDVVNAEKDLLSYTYAANKFASLKESFEQRSYALKDLVKLYLKDYYIPDSVSPQRMRTDTAESNKRAMAEARRSK